MFSSFLYEMMNINQIYYNNHFMIYTIQIIMLYALNVFSDVCQIPLNKMRKNKDKKRCNEVKKKRFYS